jgi:hypothetical protein
VDRSQVLKVGALAALGIGVGAIVFLARPASKHGTDEPGGPADSAPAVAPGVPAAPRTPEQCEQCEQQQCPVLVQDCQSQECKDALACFKKTKCAADEDHLFICYCGDIDKTACFSGPDQPKGACKQALEVAAKTTKPLEVGQRFFDRETPFPSGQAMQLAACLMRNCAGCP